MKFFGKRYSSPAYEGAEKVATPVGFACAYCDEAIIGGDNGWLIPTIGPACGSLLPFHAACHMRGIIGSVAHQKKLCSCYVPGSTTEDDPRLTRRQAAEAAEKYFLEHGS